MDADRRNRLLALCASEGGNPLVGVVYELLDEADMDTSALSASLELLRGNHSELLKAHQTLQANHAALQAETAPLRHDLATALQDLSAARRALSEQSDRADAHKAALDPYRADLGKAKVYIGELEEKVADLTAALVARTAERDDLIARLAPADLRHGRSTTDRTDRQALPE